MFLLYQGDVVLPSATHKPHRGMPTMDQDSKQDTREFLTVEQAAQYLQISQSSIRSYIRQGMLKAFRIAGKRKVLIPRTELLALLEPARQIPPPGGNGGNGTEGSGDSGEA